MKTYSQMNLNTLNDYEENCADIAIFAFDFFFLSFIAPKKIAK